MIPAHRRTFLTLALSPAALVALLAFLPGCDEKGANPGVQAKEPTTAVKQPTEAGLLERSRARWDAIAKADWIQAYDFFYPEYKKAVPLGRFLPGKENHRYEHPVVDGLLKLDPVKKEALVRIHVLWTPQHDQLKTVQLEPGQDRATAFTQEVPMVETWRWVKDEWCFVEQKGADEFFERNPELLREGAADQQANNK